MRTWDLTFLTTLSWEERDIERTIAVHLQCPRDPEIRHQRLQNTSVAAIRLEESSS